MKQAVQIQVSPEMQPFMQRHGQQATKALTQYLKKSGAKSLDDKLGALGVLATILAAHGDALREIDRKQKSMN